MSLRLEMLQAARLSPKLLGESRDLVVRFVLSQLNSDGGFRNRGGKSDLYYSVFGLECLIALGADIPTGAAVTYLRSFDDGESLDFVHLTCLARAWASLPPAVRWAAPRERIQERLESHRSPDGGYAPAPAARHGDLYSCFLSYGAYQDLAMEMPHALRLLDCIGRLRAAGGGYANQPGSAVGLTAPTAAAATLLRQLGQLADADLAEWLLARCHPEGGFFAAPGAPIPDLLSTATALHALAGMHASIEEIREPCLDFIDTLWTNRGAFYGTWEDNSLDCEYTYYALLALGHLAV